MSAPVFEDPTTKEIFRLLEKEGWELERLEVKSLNVMVADIVDFSKSSINSNIRFTADGPDTLGVYLTVGHEEYGQIRHAMPRRVLAFLDIMQILPVTDEWMQWFRNLLWGPQEVSEDGD